MSVVKVNIDNFAEYDIKDENDKDSKVSVSFLCSDNTYIRDVEVKKIVERRKGLSIETIIIIPIIGDLDDDNPIFELTMKQLKKKYYPEDLLDCIVDDLLMLDHTEIDFSSISGIRDAANRIIEEDRNNYGEEGIENRIFKRLSDIVKISQIFVENPLAIGKYELVLDRGGVSRYRDIIFDALRIIHNAIGQGITFV